MSMQSPSPEELAEVEKYLTVFEGSSREDASHARQLWSSLSLLPPQESRLVSADIRQRLPVSRCPPQQQQQAVTQQRSTTAITAGPSASVPEPPILVTAREKERQDELRRYEAMAENRREILGLLRKQREQRIKKELLSVAFKPKLKQDSVVTGKSQDRAECESDRELVQQLQ